MTQDPHSIHLFNQWTMDMFVKLTLVHLVQNFPLCFWYKKKLLNSVFTTTCCWSLSWFKWIPSFYPISFAYILILSSHVHLQFQSDLFLSYFPTKILNAILACQKQDTCPDHLIPVDLITQINSLSKNSTRSGTPHQTRKAFSPNSRHQCPPQHVILKHPQ
jgi:hypothetical protein